MPTGDAVRYRTLRTTRLRMVDCWMPPATRVAGHGHHAPHLCLVAEGGFRQRLPGEDHRLEAGSVRLSPLGAEHHMEVGGVGARLLIVHPEAASAWGAGSDLFAGADFLLLPGIETLLRRLGRSLDAAAPSPLRLEEIVDELLATVRRNRRPRSTSPPRWLLSVRERIDRSVPEVPSAAELAGDAGVHRVHLSRAFSEHFGCSLSAYIRRRRLDRGWRLLHDPGRDLAGVSAEAGFADQSHFTRLFSGALAVSPGRFRRIRGERAAAAWRSW